MLPQKQGANQSPVAGYPTRLHCRGLRNANDRVFVPPRSVHPFNFGHWISNLLLFIGFTVLETRPNADDIDSSVMKKCVSTKIKQIANNLPPFLTMAGKCKAAKTENFTSMDAEQQSQQEEMCAVRLIPRTALLHIIKTNLPSQSLACPNFNMGR